MNEFFLRDVGLETVVEAAARKGWAAPTLQKWIARGLLPAAKVGSGRGLLLVRIADVDAFVPPVREDGRGRPLTPRKPHKAKTLRTPKEAAANQSPAATRTRKARRGQG